MLAIISVSSTAAETLKVAIIRVSFQSDSSPATTGDGSFVLEDTTDIECSDWTLDPPPHGKTYFSDHMIAMDSYWQRVTNGDVNIDLDNSNIFPENENGSYVLPHDMLYYHPYLEDFDETAKLFELSLHTLALADPDINFNNYSTVILVHAGMGGDFAFALDPTPGNIPSAYLSSPDFIQYGELATDEGSLSDLIIIPESQNFLQYKETRSLFADAEDPCFYQVALNGTLALMLGFHLGLPPMYNTETGRSLVGGFALMDQGSNNFHGIVPAYPDPYSRIQAGWVEYVEKGIGDSVNIGIGDSPVRVSISETEYFLIENRQRNFIHPDTSIMPLWIDGPGFDTVSVVLSPGGVVLQVDEQDSGLPGNGLQIWHIDESAWHSAENPNGGPIQLVDYVEADGAQDMGYTTQLLFADYLETGWWFDPWFAGNEGWFHLNRKEAVIGDSLLNFSSTTFPSTFSNTGIPSHLRLENISKNGSNMTFNIRSDRVADIEGVSSFIGWGTSASQLWAFNSDSSQIIKCDFTNASLSISAADNITPSQVFAGSIDSTFAFRYPWIVPNLSNGVRFENIETGGTHYNNSIDHPFEFSGDNSVTNPFIYFAEQNDGFVIVKWFQSLGMSTIEPLLAEPKSKFQTTLGIEISYEGSADDPEPVGVTPRRDPSDIEGYPYEKVDVLSWSSSENALKITHLPAGDQTLVVVPKPVHIIPTDIDHDGNYEIALFYNDAIRIINQAGINVNGNPFSIESYYGNPIMGPMVDGELGIYLRHLNGYSIHGPSGKLQDQGILSQAPTTIENTLRMSDNLSLLLSGSELLYFEYDERSEGSQFWTDPQGRSRGDRLVVPQSVAPEMTPDMKAGSAYNYPNPVKGSTTTIRAWLGDVDVWSVEIFSLSGAQIYYTEQTVLQKNAYNEWTWDASSVSNGVFLAQIIAGNKAEIIKIAIIR